nr:MAG TPA: hypothetical protein [Caudoviricetes sp.]
MELPSNFILNKQQLKILKLFYNKNDEILQSDIENLISYQDFQVFIKENLIEITKRKPQIYKGINFPNAPYKYKITSFGIAYMENHKKNVYNTWITRGFSIISLLISLSALFVSIFKK